ncbi:unnamed protein product [Heligmosomoides polygyrus]|uniref:ANK_REP_REGION domain-containing protein n=1 Tax=Heligmosomoides polygyrus TaxID=6339 RepID=A0A183GKX1_HELPZ|nr:unnamed protein product [Heligmosomoides polygyrus]
MQDYRTFGGRGTAKFQNHAISTDMIQLLLAAGVPRHLKERSPISFSKAHISEHRDSDTATWAGGDGQGKKYEQKYAEIPHSSVSIVRSLTEVVAAQSNALVGVVTTLNALLEFAKANHRSFARTEAIAVYINIGRLAALVEFSIHIFIRAVCTQAIDFFRHYLVKACNHVTKFKYTVIGGLIAIRKLPTSRTYQTLSSKHSWDIAWMESG